MEDQTAIYQKEQFISADQLIGRALDRGVTLGPDPHQTINTYLQKGLLTQLVNGTFPSNAVDRVVSIDGMLKEGKSLEEIQEFIQKERRSFLQKATDLNTMVNLYKNTTLKSILMLGFLMVFLAFSVAFVSSNATSQGLAGGVARTAARPVGQTLAAFIKAAKPEGSNSTDPLGLTNISKVITINEKEQIVLEKTLVVETPTAETSINLNADLLDNADSGTGPGDILLLDPFGDIVIDGNITIKGVFTGNGSGLTNLPLPATLIYSDQFYTNPAWLTSLTWSKLTNRPSVVSSIEGISNDTGNIDFVADTGVTITSDDLNNTITFSLSGSGVNADLLDSLDSTQFLRSDTTDSFTSGTLTIAVGTTLHVLGTFTCTNCVGDAAVVNGLTVDATGAVNAGAVNSGTLGTAGVTLALGGFGSITGSLGDSNVADTITASNYLPLAGGTMAGNINFNNNLALNIGNAGTDFTATGGLNLAENLDVAGHGTFGATASPVASTLLQLSETISDEEIVNGIQSYPTSTYNDVLGTPQIFGIRSVPTYSGADTNAAVTGLDSIAYYTGSGSAVSLIAVKAGITTGAGSGAVNTVKAISITTPTIAGSVPTNVYGLEIQDLTVGTNRYPIYQSGSNGTNVLLAGTSLFGRAASGNDTLYRIVIQGSLCVDDSTPSCTAAPTAGAIYVENSVGTGNVSAFDVSEYYPAIEPVEKGEIVSAAGNSAVKKSSQPYDPGLIGIVSTDPAMVIDETNITFGKTAGDSFNPLKPYIALAGRVPVKVSTENGPIKSGDPLTSSSIPGIAMSACAQGYGGSPEASGEGGKATYQCKSGPIVGKALESYDNPNPTAVGKIMVFVSVSWYVAPLASQGETLQGYTAISLETLTARTVNAQVLVVGSRTITMNTDGALKIDGNVEIDGGLIAKVVRTEELMIGSKSSGIGAIAAGTKEAEIKTTMVKDASKVFVTFGSDYSPATRFWVTKKTGESFTVHLDQPPSTNVSFDWLIVN